LQYRYSVAGASEVLLVANYVAVKTHLSDIWRVKGRQRNFIHTYIVMFEAARAKAAPSY
jgi:hypothetical protein